ncbi:hypothetical protein M408DRAFT_326845 [Serendipita vermifera MAFF 305830]|uniref:Thioredoxin domain-containing protein n=1 Tax=Serendipita vermifera MAFF 305830 TaxID=933852 RepID=A0A0C2X1S2_SERVB|nr:hypothetical protein M408DRAFT_326845 [Serendipita vermifera MAFF 305830]
MAVPIKAPPSDTFDQTTLEEAAKTSVLSENGESVTFGSLFENQKTIVVFIRHFFCGICKMYVEELAKVPKSALDAAGTRIVVIGCGESSLIKMYKEDTHFPYEIYAEPTRALHKTLGFGQNLSGAKGDERRGRYVKNVFATSMADTWHALKNIGLFSKSGNVAQIGGDLVIGPGLHVTYGRRMRNSQDHVDVPELMQEAGVAYPAEGEISATD